MLIVVLLVVIALVAAGAYLAAPVIRSRRRPDELRGDWWTAFEREFRDYARAAEKRRRGERGSAGR